MFEEEVKKLCAINKYFIPKANYNNLDELINDFISCYQYSEAKKIRNAIIEITLGSYIIYYLSSRPVLRKNMIAVNVDNAEMIVFKRILNTYTFNTIIYAFLSESQMEHQTFLKSEFERRLAIDANYDLKIKELIATGTTIFQDPAHIRRFYDNDTEQMTITVKNNSLIISFQ